MAVNIIRYKCFHCGKKMERKNIKVCKKCEKLPRCEICGITFCKKSTHCGRPSPENPLRCESCLHYEENIHNFCHWCQNEIENDPKRYKIFGNCCWVCYAKYEVDRLKHEKSIIYEEVGNAKSPCEVFNGEA